MNVVGQSEILPPVKSGNVARYERRGDDLVVILPDGGTIVMSDYFLGDAQGKPVLKGADNPTDDDVGEGDNSIAVPVQPVTLKDKDGVLPLGLGVALGGTAVGIASRIVGMAGHSDGKVRDDVAAVEAELVRIKAELKEVKEATATIETKLAKTRAELKEAKSATTTETGSPHFKGYSNQHGTNDVTSEKTVVSGCATPGTQVEISYDGGSKQTVTADSAGVFQSKPIEVGDRLVVSAKKAKPDDATDIEFLEINKTTALWSHAIIKPDGYAQNFEIKGKILHKERIGAVSTAGDVNGDEYDDIILGAPFEGSPDRPFAGAVWVIYGKKGRVCSQVDLDHLSSKEGFKIKGRDHSDMGKTVSTAGDVNGDGYDDIVLGAPLESSPDRRFAGAVWVIYGRKGSMHSDIDLVNLNPKNGFRIKGESAQSKIGRTVSPLGDVNDDGIDDFTIGNGSGVTWVIYGKAGQTRSDIDLADLNPKDGSRVKGGSTDGRTCETVSSLGDVNGDGINDFTVAGGSQRAWVIFGQKGRGCSDVDPKHLSSQDGFEIERGGAADGRNVQISVFAAGDVNKDGYDDLIVKAYASDPYSNDDEEAAYIIYGSPHIGSKTIIDVVGTKDADWLTGNDDSSDYLIGNGGADVLLSYGGDDVLVVPDAGFARIDGGEGTDTLALSGLSGFTLDLKQIDRGMITGIEKIDITGSDGGDTTTVDNTLKLDISDVLDLLNTADNTDHIVIDGDTGDTVTARGFTYSDSQTQDDRLYHIYTASLHGDTATLWIDHDIGIML